MNVYRGIVYVIDENHLNLYYKAGVHKFVDSEGKLSVYRNGERYVSFPDDLQMKPEKYAEKVIDNLYSRMEYHKKEEIRNKFY